MKKRTAILSIALLLLTLCLLFAGCKANDAQAELIVTQNKSSPFRTATLSVSSEGERLTVLLSDQCLDATMSMGDLDGDGEDEYVTNVCIGGNGGYGQYLSAVYKIVDGKLSQILSGDELNVDLTTSFSPEGKVIVSIDSLGYAEELQHLNMTDSSGELIPQDDVIADSFYEFTVDSSTISPRLVGKQYLWYAFHLNQAVELTTTWEWKNDRFVPVQATVEEPSGE